MKEKGNLCGFVGRIEKEMKWRREGNLVMKREKRIINPIIHYFLLFIFS
jgi:hypothetical protein